MQPLKITEQWDEEANVWVATSDDVDGLAIEASTIDALIERLKIVIPELMEANHKLHKEDPRVRGKDSIVYAQLFLNLHNNPRVHGKD